MKKKPNIYLEPGMSELDYKAIQKEWYKKLEAEGFEDIETFNKSGEPNDILKKDVYVDFQKNPEKYAQTADYYRYAGQFLYEHKFTNLLEKSIWEAHSEGLSSREIEESLLPAKTTKTTINNILTKLKKEFKDYVLSALPNN